MLLQKKLLLFADCAVNIEPNSHDLADIALDTAKTAKRFGIEPKVAMLSFATMSGAKHPMLEKVREAVLLVRDREPNLLIEGEIQVDAAISPFVAQKKRPSSQLRRGAFCSGASDRFT